MKWRKDFPWLLWTLAGVAFVIITISLASTNPQAVSTNDQTDHLIPVTGQPFHDFHLSQPRIREIRGNFYVILNGFDELKEFSSTRDIQPNQLHLYPPNVK